MHEKYLKKEDANKGRKGRRMAREGGREERKK
jgi:hypothetical protein